MVISGLSDCTPVGDVAVVGASAAGLFTAALLAREGLSVRVYEASPSLHPLPRTLIVTGRLPEVLGFLPTEAVANQVQHMELFSPGASARVSFRSPDLIVEREWLLRLLAQRARQAGADIVYGQRFVGFGNVDADTPRSPLWLRFVDSASDQPRQERADVVIGADGVHSQVAQAAAVQPSPSVALLQVLVPLPSGFDPHTVQVWFEPHDTRFFYWLIPLSRRQAAVGLIADDAEEARIRLEHFLSAHSLEPIEYQVGSVATHRFPARPWAMVGGHRVHLVGDAAGQVKMTTVGGLVTGLRGAKLASAAVLGRSARSQRRELQRELDLHLLLRTILDRFTSADYDDILRLLNQRTRNVLQTHNRDELTRAFCRLPLAQPQLLLLAGRVLLRRAVRG